MNQKIAFLVSNNLLSSSGELRDDVFEYHEQYAKLAPAFAQDGLNLDVVSWREIAQKAGDYAAILPLMVWDYFEGHEAEFMQAMKMASSQTLLLNSYNMLKWNANKRYLDEMKSRGAEVIDTRTVERVTPQNVEAAFEVFGTDRLVIKPQIGGGAWRQVLYKKGEPFPAEDRLPPDAALIQDFLPSVQSEGEYSFLYFDGAYSPAVLKQAKTGDYRIQSIYGRRETSYEPSRNEIKTADRILDVLDTIPLYARVDLLRGKDGALKLIELELIEPYLYLPHAPSIDGGNQGAQNLAKALVRRLEAVRQNGI